MALRSPGPSIKDVARLAGVSAQTVSRVANHADNVRPETRDRVRVAMEQLGYTPNRAARALRNGTTSTIGLVSSHFERTGEALIMKSVIEAASAEGFAVSLINLTKSWNEASAVLDHQGVDAAVVIRADKTLPRALTTPSSLPIAVSDSRLVTHHPTVVSDQIQGTTDAVELLLNLGHENVHYIAGPTDSVAAQVRAAAWRRTMEVAGIPPTKLWRGDWSAASGYAIGRELAQHRDVTAVLCANDEIAFGVIRALQEQGRVVPRDVSVVGFDDIELSRFTATPLTTVHQDFEGIGHTLVRMVLDQLRGVPLENEAVTLPTELVIRGSTAPPPH